MEQVSKWAEWAKFDPAYQKRVREAMEFNRAHSISNEHYAGVIGINNKKYMEELCYGTGEQ